MAHELGTQLLSLAQQAQDTVMFVMAHRAMGSTLLFLGTPASAHTHFTQGSTLDALQQYRASTFVYGEDAGVICRSHGAWTLWQLGYADQGLTRSHEAVTLAQQSAHPLSLGFALIVAAVIHQLRREVSDVQEYAESVISLATEQGFPL